MTELQCVKHHQPVSYVCALEGCPQGYLICEHCKSKQPEHFIHHLNFIYTVKQFLMYQTSKPFSELFPKLQKTLYQCEGEIVNQKQNSKQQIDHFLNDLKRLEDIFREISRKTQQHVDVSYKHDSRLFQEKLHTLKMRLRELSIERDKQTSFFGLFSTKKDDIQANNVFDLVDKIIHKNKTLFRFRADLLNFYTEIKKSSIKVSKYKASTRANQRFNQMKGEFQRDIQRVYSQFKELFNDEELKKSMDLKRSMAYSSSSVGLQPLQLSDSQVSARSARSESAPNLHKTTIPPLSPQITTILQTLQPLPQSGLGFQDQGPFKYKQGVYFGNYINGQRHGKGKFYFNDGSFYEGYWKNDGMFGTARLINKNFFYQGEVNDGKAEGLGKMEDGDKVYNGQWSNDLKHGLGKLQYKAKKVKYQGNFQNNLFHGNGTLTTPDWRYEGGFWAGQKSGDGHQVENNGEVFRGKFRNGNKLTGKYTWFDGSYYQGTFQSDFPHGSGCFVWPDGIKYNGTWKNGEQSGIGIQIYPDGRERRGEWESGEWKRWL